MNRFPVCLVLFLLIASLLTACAQKPDVPEQAPQNEEFSEAGTPLFEFMGGDMQAFAKGFAEDTPVAACYRFDGEEGGEYAYVFDAAFVEGFFEAVSNLRITEPTDQVVVGNTAHYGFIMADGTRHVFSLNNGNLEWNGAYYQTVNRFRLRDFPFPSYQAQSVFAAYPGDAMQAFAADFFELPVVSVTCVTGDGEPVTVSEGEKISDAFLCLANAYPVAAGDSPAMGPDGAGDLPAREITFALADGMQYAFRFAGDNLAVDLPAPVGTQYFWLGKDIEQLFELF